MRSRASLAGAAGLLALAAGLLLPGGAGATSMTFSPPVKLLGGGGGEPSIATDQNGNVYVTSPQGIPAGAATTSTPNPLPVGPSHIPNGSAAGPGVVFWASHDHGASFGPGVPLGSFLGGGDSDVQVAPDDGTVGILDLEAVASAVCFSHDQGGTWQSASPVPDPTSCTVLPTGQAGPSADREWLTLDAGGRAYVTYHEFVSAQPLIFRTDNFGADAFTAGPCGRIVTDPNIEINVPQDVTGGTLMSKPVLDKNGWLYLLFTTTTQQQNVAALPGSVSGSFSQIYMAVSKDNCASFTDYTVFDGSSMGTNSVQFGDIFNPLAIDGAGTLYAVGAGYVGSAAPTANTADVFMSSSSDHGATWTPPRKVNSDVGAHMLPAAVGGPLAGQVAIGYFRTTNGKTDPNDADGKWTYTVAESSNAMNAATAGFAYADVQAGKVFHSGDICNSGLLCGSGLPGTGNDRSLLDFTQAAVDADGCPIFTFGGNPDGASNGTFDFVTKQRTGCFATTAAAVGGATPPSPAATPAGGVQGTQTTAAGTPALPNTSAVVGVGAAETALVALGGGVVIGLRRRRRRVG
jgi:hypothetical protein